MGKDRESEVEQNEELDINLSAIKKKYSKVQKKWLDGQMGTEYDANGAENDEHSYILSYLLNEKEVAQKEIVFHPTYSYSYTNYEKEGILPTLKDEELAATQKRFAAHIGRLEEKIFGRIRKQQIELNEKKKKQEEEEKEKEKDDTNKEEKGWVVPPYSIPLRADIRVFPFAELAKKQKEISGRLFDVVQMDPPWQLATANPTRGVALGYSQLQDDIISGLPIHLLQDNGLLFVWVINAKYRLALQLFKKWGYRMIGDIGWVKQTVNRRIANGHGYYLQHAKETCLIGLKGDFDKIPSLNNKRIKGVCSDVIYSERRGQSQKPEEVYQYIERLVPSGFYMEIFARRNNLRNGWFSIGNEL